MGSKYGQEPWLTTCTQLLDSAHTTAVKPFYRGQTHSILTGSKFLSVHENIYKENKSVNS